VAFSEKGRKIEAQDTTDSGRSHEMQRAALLLLLVLLAAGPSPPLAGQSQYQQDVIPTAAGDLTISFIGHGTLLFTLGAKVIHVDPVSREADYTTLPDADLILITHEHGDHLDPAAIAEISKDGTEIVVSGSCEGTLEGARVMRNGEVETLAGFLVEAVPAYNILNERSEGMPYHPKGGGNGYVITLGDLRVYVAGDTENTPEMKTLQDIDVAFLPMNLPYTMTPEMVADAARAFRPRVLYPYHFGETDTNDLVRLLENEEGIEVRVREMG
jgi:L-ascorbate metabolism protein UlaG (beta-lactamase superfamily)